LALLLGCQSGDEISQSDIQISTTEPLESKSRAFEHTREVKAREPDFVPEDLAQRVITELSHWGQQGEELKHGLLYCSALRAFYASGKSSLCFDDYSDEQSSTECLMKRGYGKKSVGQALKADRFDLNADGVPDFLLSDRYFCSAISANQASVYLVMLSQPSGQYNLAYADWAASDLAVVVNPETKTNVLVEKSAKSYGSSTRIFHLVDGRYVPRTCVRQDNEGFHKCD
jgi:hypothetical protein